MQRKRHTPEPIIRKLREADGLPAEGKTIAEINPRLEISEQIFHRWRNQYGGREHDQDGNANGEDMKHLKALQTENRRAGKVLGPLRSTQRYRPRHRRESGHPRRGRPGHVDA